MNRGFITPSIVAVDDCTFEALLADSAFQLFNGLFRSSGRIANCPCPGALIDYLHQLQGDFVVSSSASVCSKIHQAGFDG